MLRKISYIHCILMISECVIVINVIFANECYEYYKGVAKTNKKIRKEAIRKDQAIMENMR